MKVIGIAGQAGSGKDTLADYLATTLNARSFNDKRENWKRAAFAGAVKKCFADYFAVTPDFIEEWKRNPECPSGMLKSVRQSLQFIGDGFRQIKPDIWIETAFRFNAPPFILSDARYFNEARAVRQNGGINILIWRPGFENNDPNPSESQIKPTVDWCVQRYASGVLKDKNVSHMPDEVQLFDIFVRNEGEKDDLYRFADSVIVPFIEGYFQPE